MSECLAIKDIGIPKVQTAVPQQQQRDAWFEIEPTREFPNLICRVPGRTEGKGLSGALAYLRSDDHWNETRSQQSMCIHLRGYYVD